MDYDAVALAGSAEALFVDEGVTEGDGWVGAESGHEVTDADHTWRRRERSKRDPNRTNKPGRPNRHPPPPIISKIGNGKEPQQTANKYHRRKYRHNPTGLTNQIIRFKGKHNRISMCINLLNSLLL